MLGFHRSRLHRHESCTSWRLLFFFHLQGISIIDWNIHRSAATLRPLTSEGNNVQLLITSKCSAGKLWIMSLSHTVHTNTDAEQAHPINTPSQSLPSSARTLNAAVVKNWAWIGDGTWQRTQEAEWNLPDPNVITHLWAAVNKPDQWQPHLPTNIRKTHLKGQCL